MEGNLRWQKYLREELEPRNAEENVFNWKCGRPTVHEPGEEGSWLGPLRVCLLLCEVHPAAHARCTAQKLRTQGQQLMSNNRFTESYNPWRIPAARHHLSSPPHPCLTPLHLPLPTLGCSGGR